jgi:hypothetical protein
MALIGVLLQLAGCGAPVSRAGSELPALVLQPVQPVQLTHVGDQRAYYRQQFCKRLDAQWTAPCETYLRKFPDEAIEDQTEQLTLAQRSLPINLFVVSGVFAECFPALKAFGDARTALSLENTAFFDVPVHGRGSTELNSEIVRDFILAELARQSSPRINIILSYSKGTADSLAALAGSRALAQHIDALLSVAGAVNGSPLADTFEQAYASFASGLPLNTCKATDRGELTSLTRDTRLNWLTAHPPPPHPRYYSLVAAPTPDRISLLLKLPYRRLANIDARNDGQLLAWDAIVPGSTILGYVNADHFAVALPLMQWHPHAMGMLAKPNDFPRLPMLAAALAVIGQELATPRQPDHH